METAITDRSILEEWDVFHLSDNKTILLTKMRCKDYYKLFQEKIKTEPTAVKSWSKRGPDLTHCWNKLFKNIYKISIDNKLREFAFKLYHRILVTNKELKRFKIRNDDACSQCQNADSLEHTFLECPTSIKFYQEILSWFNALENTQINLSKEQFLFQNYTLSPAVHRSIRRRLDLSVLFMKKYLYTCKMTESQPSYLQFLNNLNLQWKIEQFSSVTFFLFFFSFSLFRHLVFCTCIYIYKYLPIFWLFSPC